MPRTWRFNCADCLGQWAQRKLPQEMGQSASGSAANQCQAQGIGRACPISYAHVGASALASSVSRAIWLYSNCHPSQTNRRSNLLAKLTGTIMCRMFNRAFAMISPEQVWLVVEPVDMRLGIDGLSLSIQQALGRSPCDGTAYAFRNRHSNRIKLLVWDGAGVWLCVRRLHQGRFTWPQSHDQIWPLTPAEWHWLSSGIDWRKLNANPPKNWQV